MNELLQANIFSAFPGQRDISFVKEVTPKLLRFEVTGAEQTKPLYLAAVISREEKMLWQSFQDVLDYAASLAQNDLRGFFGVNVLIVDLKEGIRHFDPTGLAKLFVNHGRELGPDRCAMIRYGQLYCLLQKRAPADWGKIELKTHVTIVDPEKNRMETFFKKMVRESGKETGAGYVLHDLSTSPVFDLSAPFFRDSFGAERDGLKDIYVYHSEAGLVRCLE